MATKRDELAASMKADAKNTNNGVDTDKKGFVLESEEEYLQVLDEAKKLMYDESIPEEVKQHYMKFVNQAAQEIKKGNGHVDINSAEVRKSYLGLRKFVKYKEKAPITTRRGFFDENSPLLGVNAKAHKEVVELCQGNGLCEVFERNLCKESDAYYHMIPAEDREAAERIGEEMLNEELAKYGLKKEDVFAEPSDTVPNTTFCHSGIIKGEDWHLRVYLDETEYNGEYKGQYCPLGVIALSELDIVKQTMPGVDEKEFQKERGSRLAATIDMIVRQDEIYKRIHGIDMAQVVDYPIDINFGMEASLGQLANEFRKIKEKYGYDSYDEVLLTREGRDYMFVHGDSFRSNIPDEVFRSKVDDPFKAR